MADTPDGGGGQRRAVSARATSTTPVEVHDEDSAITGIVDEPPAPPPRLSGSRPSMKRRITRPSFMIELVEGSPVGEYEIQGQIGEGAMGTVYSAIHPVIGKTVAIKVLKPELCANQASIDRFVQEAQSVNRIGHPNIVDVFALGELPDGRAYFVMEWLRGEDLKARLARGPITVSDACDILDGVARALDAAHAKEVVHRDLKPDNVYLHQVDKGPLMVKLLDFGIAKLMRSQAKMEKTQTGNMLGTPRYISPEQARGVDVDHRADIYSLGVIAYEMLAGRPPFQAETAMDIVMMHLTAEPPPLSQFARVPKLLEQCVMRMLEKDPADRPSLEIVRQILIDPTRRFPTLPSNFGGRTNTKKIFVVAAAVVVAIALGTLTWRLVGGAAATDSPSSTAAVVTAKPEPASPPGPAPEAVPTPEPVLVPEVANVATQGTLLVNVKGASNAVISVGGKEYGRGEAVEVGLTPGEHTIEVRAPGRTPLRQRVEIKAGQSNTVAFVVPPAPRTPPRVTRKTPQTGAVKPPPDDDDLLAPKKRRR